MFHMTTSQFSGWPGLDRNRRPCIHLTCTCGKLRSFPNHTNSQRKQGSSGNTRIAFCVFSQPQRGDSHSNTFNRPTINPQNLFLPFASLHLERHRIDLSPSLLRALRDFVVN
jgi:hypothetical protein